MRHIALAISLGRRDPCWLRGPHLPDRCLPGPVERALHSGEGDRLRVIVFGQDALSNSYSVNGAGIISMPLIGNVADRHDHEQAERAMEGRLRDGFLREPHVSVEVEAFRPFFVLGEVTAAGQYPFVNGMTVQKAIAVAGGFTPRA